MYRHSVPLSKGQRGGGRPSTDTHHLYLRSEGRWETVYQHSGPLPKGHSRDRRQCAHTQDLYLKVRGQVGDSVQTSSTSM